MGWLPAGLWLPRITPEELLAALSPQPSTHGGILAGPGAAASDFIQTRSLGRAELPPQQGNFLALHPLGAAHPGRLQPPLPGDVNPGAAGLRGCPPRWALGAGDRAKLFTEHGTHSPLDGLTARGASPAAGKHPDTTGMFNPPQQCPPATSSYPEESPGMPSCPGHLPASLGSSSHCSQPPAPCAGTGCPSLALPPTPELPMAPHTGQTHEAPAVSRGWAQHPPNPPGSCLILPSLHYKEQLWDSSACPQPPQGHRGPPQQPSAARARQKAAGDPQ